MLAFLCAALQTACKTNFPPIPGAPHAQTDKREKELPDALDKLLLEGERAERTGDVAGAGAVYRNARGRFPEYALAWSYYGEYLRFYSADSEAAARAFRRAIAAPYTDKRATAFAWRGLAEIALHQGSIDEAIRLLHKSIDLIPMAAAHRSLSALLATAYRDFAGAAEHASLALQLVPDDPLALLQYAVQLVRLGKPVEGRSAFVRALELGGARGNIGKHDRAAVLPKALGQRRNHQRSTPCLVKPIAKVRRAGRNSDQTIAFVERHDIALEPMLRRQASGGNGRRGHPRRRRKDAAMAGEDPRIADQPRQVRGEFRRNHVGPEAIADDEHRSLHRILSHLPQWFAAMLARTTAPTRRSDGQSARRSLEWEHVPFQRVRESSFGDGSDLRRLTPKIWPRAKPPAQVVERPQAM